MIWKKAQRCQFLSIFSHDNNDMVDAVSEFKDPKNW